MTYDDGSHLKPGQTISAEETDSPHQNAFAERISERISTRVLERDRYTCQMCGAAVGDNDDQNPGTPVRLHVGHIVDRSHGGTDEPSNLRALCSACYEGAKHLTKEAPSWTWLRAQIRRAPVADQRRVLDSLRKKFDR